MPAAELSTKIKHNLKSCLFVVPKLINGGKEIEQKIIGNSLETKNMWHHYRHQSVCTVKPSWGLDMHASISRGWAQSVLESCHGLGREWDGEWEGWTTRGSSLQVEEGRRHEKVAANYYQPM